LTSVSRDRWYWVRGHSPHRSEVRTSPHWLVEWEDMLFQVVRCRPGTYRLRHRIHSMHLSRRSQSFDLPDGDSPGLRVYAAMHQRSSREKKQYLWARAPYSGPGDVVVEVECMVPTCRAVEVPLRQPPQARFHYPQSAPLPARSSHSRSPHLWLAGIWRSEYTSHPWPPD
jgi:hypothetical protein